MPRRRRTPHDAAWKQFFALPVAVEHLLRGFLPDVAALLDFKTLGDISGEWVQDGARRRADAVWRADYRDGSGRSLVVFLEFQSTVDTGMARRSLHTVGMAWERMRRAGTLDADRRLRSLFVVVHSGRLPWTAAGAANRVDVSPAGEVLSPTSAPYVALDARRHPRDHLPTRNLVSVLFELNGIEAVADTAAPLAALGGWLPDLGSAEEPALAAYKEWLSTINPTLFPADSAADMVRKLTQRGAEKDSMAYSVLEDKLRQRLRESEARGEARAEARGIARERELLREQASRKFGDAAGRRVAAALAGIGDEAGLLRVGRWIIDCGTAAELLARIDAANPSA